MKEKIYLKLDEDQFKQLLTVIEGLQPPGDDIRKALEAIPDALQRVVAMLGHIEMATRRRS